MSRLTVGILFGGASSEYEVSLMSASSVLNHINREKYDIVMLGITKDGKWLRYRGEINDIKSGNWVNGNVTPAYVVPDRALHGIIEIGEDGTAKATKLDAVFPVMHGKNCEDGTLQGLFMVAGIPFVGCDTLSSAICMDKVVTHTVMDNAGITTAKWDYCTADVLDNFEPYAKTLAERFGYPMFVKPANAGSSVGVNKATNSTQLKAAIKIALQHDKKVVIEQAVVGQEVECAVLGNRNPVASVVGEIAPKAEFYDYDAKYISDTTDLFIPARIPEAVAEKVRETAVKAYRALFCTGLSRVDFFVRANGEVVFNEINTIPGFTHISMYPKLFEAYGIPYSELIDKLIELALERKFMI
ncbi:D-alanine--D-alanine ligase family protein [Acetanaerobacterium elongatum]|uniref:D-alanine--D-alanine ligase n=1 Tax=Acetanaerobacterium elongatum TaxID=258515 RepID=A0A1H0GAX7_9FIRM|nr:D-alanine--D-alanine ligase family protein [Acetanaerobacterium elongatum]SDO04030.1 D-alanine-D-alanine ligase [Acetanaerobacterium elongatum]